MLAKSPIDILVTSAVKSKISFLGPVTQSSAEGLLSSEIHFSLWYKLMKGLREVTLIVRSSLHNNIYAWTVVNFCVLCAVLCTWHAPCEPFMVGKLQWGQLAAKLHSHVWQIHVEIQKIQGGGRVCSWHGPCKVSMAWGWTRHAAETCTVMSECCTHLWKPTKGGLGTRQTIYLEKKCGCNCLACPLLFDVFLYLCISPVECFVCVLCLYLSLYFWMVLNWRGARWPSWEQPSRTTTDHQPSLHRLDLLLGSFLSYFSDIILIFLGISFSKSSPE